MDSFAFEYVLLMNVQKFGSKVVNERTQEQQNWRVTAILTIKVSVD